MTETRNIILTFAGVSPLLLAVSGCSPRHQRPNILFVIADDMSYPYASAYGSRCVETPGFDYVAEHGAIFNNAYVTSPGSSPSRASILTGLYPWQIEEAGTHASCFPADYVCYPDVFKDNGYAIGYTGKGWGPGNWEISGRPYNPAGPVYNDIKLDPPYSGISKVDYSANFRKFLDDRPTDSPFCFWLGTHEPHRPYENMSWIKAGDSIDVAEVPGFLPDADEVRSDILDYAVEIEWFDSQLLACIRELEKRNELDNTIIIVMADNGMSFPHAKANCYEPGLHVPMAICWGNRISAGKEIRELVSGVDIFPTLLEAAGIEWKNAHTLVGQSMMPLLDGREKDWTTEDVFSGRERHSCSRYGNSGYPMRSIRSGSYLLIHNFHPERYPAGDPQALDKKGRPGEMHKAYFDIDTAPSKDYLTDHRNDPDVKAYFDAAVALRPEFEMYNIDNDPSCMNDISDDPAVLGIFKDLKAKLHERLVVTGDTRVGDNPEIWESYPRLEGKMRQFPKTE